MLIVLEGCDGSGKTTFAKKLAQLIDAEIIHCTTETPNDYQFFKDIIEVAEHKNIIADRFCYGQFVYQAPEERKLTRDGLYELELLMLERGVSVIYVECTEDELNKRLERRNETPTRPVHEIIDAYTELWQKSLLPIKIVCTALSSGLSYHFYKMSK